MVLNPNPPFNTSILQEKKTKQKNKPRSFIFFLNVCITFYFTGYNNSRFIFNPRRTLYQTLEFIATIFKCQKSYLINPIIDKQGHDLHQSLEAHIHKKLYLYGFIVGWLKMNMAFCVLGPSNKRGWVWRRAGDVSGWWTTWWCRSPSPGPSTTSPSTHAGQGPRTKGRSPPLDWEGDYWWSHYH